MGSPAFRFDTAMPILIMLNTEVVPVPVEVEVAVPA
jgi:hypothetical protein